MGFQPPSNQAAVANLSNPTRHAYDGMYIAAQRAAARDPSLDMSVVTQYLHDYINTATQHDQLMASTRHRANGVGAAVDPRQFTIMSNTMKRQFNQNFTNHTLPSSGARGQKAWRAFEASQRDMENPLYMLLRQFYDDQKGGIRYGGILGGVAGLLAGNVMIPEGQGVVGLIARGFAITLAAWGGNKLQDFLEEKFARQPAKPSYTPIVPRPVVSTSPALEQARSQQPATENHVSNDKYGSLSPSLPAAAATAPARPAPGGLAGASNAR